MKKYNFIGLKEQTIFGVKNPLLYIQGSIYLKNYDFLVYADGEEIQTDIMQLGDMNSFLLQAKLPATAKKIKVFVKSEGKLYPISSLKNNIFGRLFRKIKSLIKKIICNLFLILGWFLKNSKDSWTFIFKTS